MCLVTQSCLTLCDPMDCGPPGSSVQWDSPGRNTGVGCHALLQGIFPNQGSNPGLPHCRRILYHLSHQGSPWILEWVAYPSSGGLPDPGIEPGSPALEVDSSPAELPGKPGISSLQHHRWIIVYRVTPCPGTTLRSVGPVICPGREDCVDVVITNDIYHCLGF